MRALCVPCASPPRISIRRRREPFFALSVPAYHKQPRLSGPSARSLNRLETCLRGCSASLPSTSLPSTSTHPSAQTPDHRRVLHCPRPKTKLPALPPSDPTSHQHHPTRPTSPRTRPAAGPLAFARPLCHRRPTPAAAPVHHCTALHCAALGPSTVGRSPAPSPPCLKSLSPPRTSQPSDPVCPLISPPHTSRHHVVHAVEAHQEFVIPSPCSCPPLPRRPLAAVATQGRVSVCRRADSRARPELKETHLGPLSAFSRSPSTSTITDKDEKTQPSPGATTPTTESAIGKSSLSRPMPRGSTRSQARAAQD